MKIRTGFVSNSSSSSFIIISNSGNWHTPNLYDNETLIVDETFGNCEFGWEFENYRSTGDKIIFAYLQSKYKEEWFVMLEKVVKGYTGCLDIKWNITGDFDDRTKTWAYIDHQSSASEGENIEMFENEEELTDFLFNSESYIKGGNDNC